MNTDNPDKALGKESRFGRISGYLLLTGCITFAVVMLCSPG